ncbi:T9SS type A sorting domain-containing protein [uncultured Polaribacter sp.]|uniref:T9SS type A sorting domain-containing protein n=1 Tax=uncultured Polaribacter sp. TaxID=174711 RepID=UPI002623027A|nr:T9SS type A sorting domain-containing protein [uncultured Polaribacter sp.]
MIKFLAKILLQKILFFTLFTLSISSTAQKGPGGIGNTDGLSSLVLWTNPDDIIEVDDAAFAGWDDLSGFSSDLTQPTTILQPKIKKNLLNGYDIVRFDETVASIAADGKRLQKTNFTNFPTTAISGFYVNKTADASSDGVLSYASTASNNNFLIFNSDNLQIYRNNRRTYNLEANTNVWNIVGFGWNSVGGTSRMSLNGTNSITVSANQSGTPITAGGDLALAGEQDGNSGSPYSFDPNQAHQGDFSEVIIFNTYITDVERIIVGNYLSAKYDIVLDASKNFYDEDTSGEDFDFNVAGIGQASDGSNHTDSQGTGIIKINTPSSLSDGDYLFWGEDVKDASYNFSLSSDYNQVLDTKWRVSKTNDLGTVSVSIAGSDLDFAGNTPCSIQLIIDNDSDFSSPTSTITFTESGGIYTATGVPFTDNDYFTIQYQDLIVVDDTQFYNGSGNSNVPNTSNNCYKLLVKSSSDGSFPLTEDANVREIAVESGGILAVNSGFKLQVANGIANDGEIRLVGTSQLVQTHTGTNLNTGSGSLYVDQTASTGNVYNSGYWSSPVRKTGTTVGTDFSIDDILKDGSIPIAATPTLGEAIDIDFIAGFDGDNSSTPIKISDRWLATLINAQEFTLIDATDAVLKPGLGWNMKSTGASFTFKGIPNDGIYTASISEDNYSLLGNPYPSALDSEKFITDNLTEIVGTIYIYNSGVADNSHVRSEYTGSYDTIVLGITTGDALNLPIGQAFIITRTDTGSGTATFQNSQRTGIDVSATPAIIAKTRNTNSFPILRLGFEFDVNQNQTYKRSLVVAFRGLTASFENGYDGEMFDQKPSDLSLKIQDSESPFVISSIEDFNEDLEIPLKLVLDQNRAATFKINALENFDPVTIYLNDRLENKFYTLSEEGVILNLNQGTYENRFFITFKNNTLSTLEPKIDSNSIKIISKKDKEVVINNPSSLFLKTLKVYDLLGKQILDTKLETLKSQINLDLNNNSSSIYIIVLETNNGVIRKKIILH